jgi:hypothetical protein
MGVPSREVTWCRVVGGGGTFLHAGRLRRIYALTAGGGYAGW